MKDGLIDARFLFNSSFFAQFTGASADVVFMLARFSKRFTFSLIRHERHIPVLKFQTRVVAAHSVPPLVRPRLISCPRLVKLPWFPKGRSRQRIRQLHRPLPTRNEVALL